MVKRYDSDSMNQLIKRIYQAYGFTTQQSQAVADMLVYTDLIGVSSHGVQRLIMYDRNIQNGKVQIHSQPEIVKETDVSAVVDAKFGLGQLNGIYSMKLAIQKAKAHGIGIVTTRNSLHYGIAGYYANLAANEGLIGMSSTNSRPGMVPTNATQTFIGTNPIGFAMPAKPHNFIYDVATTTVPQGKIEVYRKLEKAVPAAWVAKDGKQPANDITDDETLKQLRIPESPVGLTPLGGVDEKTGSHKGYGLGVIVEIFTGILSMGHISNEITTQDLQSGPSQSFVAIDPGIFGDKGQIIERFSTYLQELRDLPAVSGKTVYVHGDKEAIAYEDRKQNGIIVDDKTMAEVVNIAKRLGVDYADLIQAR